MTLVLDAGALIALERRDRRVSVRLTDFQRAGVRVLSHGGVVGQVWRDGARQAVLARALSGVDVLPLDDRLGRRAGALLALTGGADVIDAALIATCRDGDEVLTSDPDDLAELARAADLHVDIVPV